MIAFGKTWWGQQWLNALSKIDNDNRLPRGRSYANKGAVTSIVIDKNKISAKVNGSRVKPYKVHIAVPLFSGQQVNELTLLVKENPQILSKLLNKELDPELDILARKKGIHIFPASWRDIEMSCDCPDWAVPCKHIAALIYMIANEIDKNPFILLNLHGCDLLKSIAPGNSDNNHFIQVPDFYSLLGPSTENQAFEHSIETLLSIDFSCLSKAVSNPLQLLKSLPLFYPKDFQELLQKAYNSISKQAKKYLNIEYKEQHEIPSSVPFTIVYNVDNNSAYVKNPAIKKDNGIPIETLMEFLLSIEDKKLISLDYNTVYLQKVLLFCLHLSHQGLFVPQIWDKGNDSYYIRWVPAHICPEVKDIANKLIGLMPPGIIEIAFNKERKSKFQIKTSLEQFNSLCNTFLHHLIDLTYKTGAFPRTWYEKDNHSHILKLFGEGEGSGYKSFEMSLIPLSIHQWLGIFEITAHRFVPIIQIEEQEQGFGITVLVKDNEMISGTPISLNELFLDDKYDRHSLEVLKDLSAASYYFPYLDNILKNKGQRPLVLNLSDFKDVLTKMLPAVKLLGITILLPKSLKNLVRPQLSLQLNPKSKGASVKSLLSLSNIIEYDWQVSLGDEQMSFAQFKIMVHGLSGLVKLKDQYLFLDQSEIAAMQKNLEKQKELSSFQLLQAALAEEINGIKAGLNPDVIKLIQELINTENISLPAGLKATLRPYQIRGFEWIIKNSRLNIGSILADDMGLGKTIQAITALLYFKQEGQLEKNKALVIAPTSLITNWQKEIQRFAPSLSVHIYHGSVRKNEFHSADITLTSYGLLRNDLSQFEKEKWHSVIIDEAQNIKNPNTEQTKAIKKLKAEVCIALSGTPVENRLGEYWSIFDFTNKGYLGSHKAFDESIAKPIHLNHDQSKIEYFRRITAPFIMRRLKTDKSIIADLPDKIENNQYCCLSEKQAALYQSLVNETMNKIENSEGIERKGLVLALMIALKQIGNHPYQYLKQGNQSRNLSGKTEMLFDLLNNIIEVNEKVLVFTQFKEMGDLLESLISQHTHETPLFLHGSLSRAKRDEMVELFQKSNNHRIFILSLKAGGTGLNLTAANHVIHYDLWWNPAVESQATDRAFRIGQTKNVIVHRLINKGTLEEKIDNMISEKRTLADLTVASGENWLGDLKNEEIKQLLTLEI